ncbi:DUF308 domain-containing protein [Mangrovibrevibacter kandeliae]|uniref:DUF308 domain-containing protein n=1 Tax=Mangrovibrevibacter kandeliae TaxID=2968473 RepID=UPI002118E857|nr:DUF308 domain-containing protein [Aurantimonas sp. CSK15Z-1]
MSRCPDAFAQPSSAGRSWLKSYYFIRAAVSVAWVAAAFSVGHADPAVAAALLVAYPAWDAVANYLDARQSGGLARNGSQRLNLIVSIVTTVAIAVALGWSMNAVLGVFGVWASLSGLFQLVTGVRRWKRFGAQWAMILSGGQSAIAGCLFVARAATAGMPGVTDVAPYAAFGAFYFLVSAVWLTVQDRREGAHAA